MHSCKRTQRAANVQSEADKEALFQQFHAWAAGMNAQAQAGSQVDSKKVRDRDHASRSATQAAPLRTRPRSQPAKRARGTSAEQSAVTECRRDFADPGACNRASEEAWWAPFSGSTSSTGATQGISTSDPSGGFRERQPVLR